MATDLSGQGLLVYVGCRTTRERHARGKGLSTWLADAADLSRPWHQVGLVESVNPSYLALDADRQVLWTVHGDFGECTAYPLDADRIPRVGTTVATNGRNLVHLAAPRPDTMVVANYATGTLASVAVGPDGLPTRLRGLLELPGDHGPHPIQQTGSHPHQVLVDSVSPGLAWVPDKGLDRVFGVDVSQPMPSIVSELRCPPGSGPRHGARHPNLDLLYVAEELSSCVAVHAIHDRSLETVHRMSTRTAGYEGDSTAAGIVITPDGRSLIVSNRGDETLAFVELGSDGMPTSAQHVPTGVEFSRFITLTPDGTGLLVAGEGSDDIVLHDLTCPDRPLRTVARTGSPTCILFGGPVA